MHLIAMILRCIVIFCFIICQKGEICESHMTDALASASADNMRNECEIAGVCETLSARNSSRTEESFITLSGRTNVMPVDNNNIELKSQFNVTNASKTNCPGLEGANSLTQTQLIKRLTAPCRYDRLERPEVLYSDGSTAPVDVYARTFIYVMQNSDSSDLQLKMFGLLQLRYVDPRLAFGQFAPSRLQPILGEAQLRELIWVPHLFLANEHESGVLGTNEKDILTSIAPDGTVIISTRIRATLYCWMDLKKFPFDEQYCSTLLESWMYNTSDLLLHWEEDLPIAFDPQLHLTEYALLNAWCNESIVVADDFDMRHGAFAGRYSSLNFTVYLVRESGYYVMDYFLPSIMIVTISWVSFWLQADQTPARTTLGTSTMLSFITLASSQDKNLPKVSYIKISEIWFLGCTLFIFSSLLEFAFVNTIWRRNHNVEVKKVKSKYIFKSTLTPRVRRKSVGDGSTKLSGQNSHVACSTNSLTVSIDNGACSTESCANSEQRQTWASMTPQEVSLWIDRKARFFFPLAFLIFNAIFWLFVYCL